ncbi:type IV toxin-antitoxin system AbiEi family antitoxin [Hymenobacter fodinae]|uniref:Uncharacterized protein n=1 Tax=Hymenobacter fodinae TaxID=2510796 RepID=A0A4Z0NYT0_9BACT|nr:type IV toxin-antitoxin system AbiEi family antitoxin [Hymenobacter fodinae]TGE03800.1 hypothetical protein EU556_24635 [Hymenobacter fodinae]
MLVLVLGPQPDSALHLLDHVREYLQRTLCVTIGVCPPGTGYQWWRWEQGLLTKVLTIGTVTPPRIAQLAEIPPPLLLVTEYVSPSLAEQLRRAGICYADRAGNAWLRWGQPQWLVLLQGFRRLPLPCPTVSASIRSAQMRFVFQLLTSPALPSYAPASLATHTGLKLALVERLILQLQQQELWLPTGPGHLAPQMAPLARYWVSHYPEALRPRLNPQRYRWSNPQQTAATLAQLRFPPDTWWSGETAANLLLAEEALPTSFVIYSRQIRPRLAEQLGLVPHNRGNVEILTPFFSQVPPASAAFSCVDPMLVYTDLLLLPTAPGRQLQQRFKQRFLSALLRAAG